MPLDPNSGLPIDPQTLQALQQQELARNISMTGGNAAERMNDMGVATAVNTLFPTPAVQRARSVQAAMQAATLQPNDGESDLDFSIRQLRAQRDAVAPIDPESAAGLNTRLLKLGQAKLEQAHLTAQDTRADEQESDLHAERVADLPVRQLQGEQAQAQREVGIPAYIGTNLSGTNPTFTPFDLSDPDSRAAYLAAKGKPGAIPLSQETVEKITLARQERLATANAQLTAGSLPGDTKELLYQRYLTTGKLDTSGMTRQPAMVANLWNYVAQRSAQDGNSAAAAFANGQATQAAGSVLKSYESGQDHKSLLAINTAVNHLTGLDPLINALGTGDLRAFNAARIAFQQQTGDPAPGNFEMLRNMIVGEVAKATFNLGGTEAERNELTKPLASANSPEQLRQAAATAARILAGKTDALKLAWDTSTGGRFGDFDARFLSPATRRMLGRPAVIPGSVAAPSVTGVPLGSPGPGGQRIAIPPAGQQPPPATNGGIPAGWSVTVR